MGLSSHDRVSVGSVSPPQSPQELQRLVSMVKEEPLAADAPPLPEENQTGDTVGEADGGEGFVAVLLQIKAQGSESPLHTGVAILIIGKQQFTPSSSQSPFCPRVGLVRSGMIVPLCHNEPKSVEAVFRCHVCLKTSQEQEAVMK